MLFSFNILRDLTFLHYCPHVYWRNSSSTVFAESEDARNFIIVYWWTAVRVCCFTWPMGTGRLNLWGLKETRVVYFTTLSYRLQVMHRADGEICNVEDISVFSYILLLCRQWNIRNIWINRSSARAVKNTKYMNKPQFGHYGRFLYVHSCFAHLRKHFLLPSNFLSWSLCFDKRTNDDDVKYFFVQWPKPRHKKSCMVNISWTNKVVGPHGLTHFIYDDRSRSRLEVEDITRLDDRLPDWF